MAEFQFLLHNGSFVTYDDWEDVPEDLQFRNVIKFIPDYPAGDSISIHHLLTHTSGIKDFTKIKRLTLSQGYKYASIPWRNTLANIP